MQELTTPSYANFRRLFTLLAALLVSFALVATTAPTASAATTQPKLSKAQQAEVDAVSRILSQARDGSTVDYQKALRAAGAGYASVARDYAVGTLSAGGSVRGMTATQSSSVKARGTQLSLSTSELRGAVMPAAKAKCKGVNSLTHQWYGWRLKLSTCNVERIQGHAVTIGVVAGILATIFPLDARSKAVVAVAVVIDGAGAWALGVCNHKGRGVKIYKYSVSPLSVWCRSQ